MGYFFIKKNDYLCIFKNKEIMNKKELIYRCGEIKVAQNIASSNEILLFNQIFVMESATIEKNEINLSVKGTDVKFL